MATTTLNARVKQKVATEAYWLANQNTLGPILEGEQAFVINGVGTPVNFKVGDGTRLFSQLPYFIAYFNNVTNCKVLEVDNSTSNNTITNTFKNKTLFSKFIFENKTASPITVNIGTTNGGSDILSFTMPVGITVLDVDSYFTSLVTLYITGLTGNSHSYFILYYQLDEQPVIPSGGGGSSSPKWVYGTIYAFYPMYAGHENACFDLLTGLGKSGTDYAGAVLSGTNGIPDLSEYYLTGYKSGDTLGGDIGANSRNIDFTNLPELKIDLPANSGGASGSGGITFNGANNNNVVLGVKKKDGTQFTSQQPLNMRPLSKSVLLFTGLPTT